MAVDTHVKSLSMTLGPTDNRDPDEIEKNPEKPLPKYRWRRFSDIFLYRG